jgi:hypothetical protein
MESKSNQHDGMVSSLRSQNYMEDLKFFIDNSISEKKIATIKRIYREIGNYKDPREYTKAQNEIDNPHMFECIFRDFTEIKERDPYQLEEVNKPIIPVLESYLLDRAKPTYPVVPSSGVIDIEVEKLTEIYPKKWSKLFDAPESHLKSLANKGKFSRIEMYTTSFLQDHINWNGFWKVLNNAYTETTTENITIEIVNLLDLFNKYYEYHKSHEFLSAIAKKEGFKKNRTLNNIIEYAKSSKKFGVLLTIIDYGMTANADPNIKSLMTYIIEEMVERKNYSTILVILHKINHASYHKFYKEELMAALNIIITQYDEYAAVELVQKYQTMFNDLFSLQEFVEMLLGKSLNKASDKEWDLVFYALKKLEFVPSHNLKDTLSVKFMESERSPERLNAFYDNISRRAIDPRIHQLSKNLSISGPILEKSSRRSLRPCKTLLKDVLDKTK